MLLVRSLINVLLNIKQSSKAHRYAFYPSIYDDYGIKFP